MLAARNGQDTAVHLLLTMPGPESPNQADPNAQDNRGDTALHYATSYGHLKVARTLLAHGADPWITNHFSWTPIDYSSTAQAEAYLRELVADMERRRMTAARLRSASGGDAADSSSSTGGAIEGLLGRGGVRLVPASDSGSNVSIESGALADAEKERGSPGRIRRGLGAGVRNDSYGSSRGVQTQQGLTTPTRERVDGPFGSPS